MTLTEFKTMWCSDGTKLVEQDKRVLDDKDEIWYLFAVYFPESTVEHGRHMAMILKCSNEDEIMMHDLKNISGTAESNRRLMDEWFERHVGKY